MGRVERREYPRVDMNIPALICNINGDGMPVKPRECYVADLSATGAKVLTSGEYREGQVLILTVRAYAEAELHSIVVLIVRANPYREGNYAYGLKFLNMSTSAILQVESEVNYLLAAQQSEHRRP